MANLDPIGAALLAAVDAGTFPGAVLAVRHQGVLVYEQAVGCLSLAPAAGPATVQTLYDLASLTKPLATTTAILLLVQQGQLALDSRIQEWIDPFSGTPLGATGLIHLLTHSSGLPGWRPFYERLSADGLIRDGHVDRDRAKAAVIGYIRDEPLLYQPGTRSLYSDLGFMLLGFIIEQVTEQSLEEFCEHELFAPLAAAPLAYLPNGKAPSDTRVAAAHPIAPTEDDPWRGRPLCGEVHDENAYALGGIAGHAGLFGTARAVLAVSSAWLAAYQGQRSILEAALVRRFATRQGTISDSSWALGWDTPSAPSSAGAYFSDLSFGHLGYTGTSLWIDPSQRLEVVLLSNRVHPTRRNERIREFRPHIHNVVWQEIIGKA
jgi:CubicO group peptidase (beta-lactamase class C family)